MTADALAPEPPPATRGEIWRGDAFDLAARLEPKSLDLIITSPPYWGMRSYGLDHNEEILAQWLAEGHLRSETPSYEWYRDRGGVLGLEPLPEWFVEHLAELFHRLRPALKDQGSVWVNLGDTYFARWSSIRHDGRQGLGDNPRSRRKTPMGGHRQEKQLLLIPARFAIAMQDDRWILRNDVIWHKPNIAPRPEKDRLRLSHEHFFHFVQRPKEGRAKYYYDLDAVEAGSRDVVTVNARSGSDGHSATFPPELIRPRIESSSPPGGLVLDPFAGTGRAVCMALSLGRNGLGFELSETFADAAMKNVRLVEQEGRLF